MATFGDGKSQTSALFTQIGQNETVPAIALLLLERRPKNLFQTRRMFFHAVACSSARCTRERPAGAPKAGLWRETDATLEGEDRGCDRIRSNILRSYETASFFLYQGLQKFFACTRGTRYWECAVQVLVHIITCHKPRPDCKHYYHL